MDHGLAAGLRELFVFDPDRWYAPTEIWRESHGARAQAYEALERGELRGHRRGRRWLVPGQAAKDWIGGDAVAIRRPEQDQDGATG